MPPKVIVEEPIPCTVAPASSNDRVIFLLCLFPLHSVTRLSRETASCSKQRQTTQSKGLLIHSCWTYRKTDLLTRSLSHSVCLQTTAAWPLSPPRADTALAKITSAPGCQLHGSPSVLLLLDLSTALNSAGHTCSLKYPLLLVFDRTLLIFLWALCPS